jgi:ankyrin repeat protein
MHRGRLPTALAQIRAWHPGLARASDDVIAAAPFGQDDARLVYARQNGASTWDELVTRVTAMARPAADGAGAGSGPKRVDRDDADRSDGDNAFARAFAALERRDAIAFRAAVDWTPRIVRERGTNGNSLLNLAVAIAGEHGGFVETLLAASADPNVPNDRGWTPLHQAAMKDLPALVDRLIAAGAVVTIAAHGDGGTPLAAALIWSHRASAARLASIAIVPDNLRIHAALNDVNALPGFFRGDGALTTEAKVGRGFYRVHSGFPAWTPSDRDQEVLDEALSWAARNDAVDAMAFLVAHGADVNGIAYRGTPLMHAAYHRHIAAVRWLLEHGADVNQRATFHGMETGRCTVLHLAAQTDDAELVSLLLSHGADRAIHDENYDGDAAGWARHVGASRTLGVLE